MKKILVIHDNCRAAGGSNNYRKQLSMLLRKRGIEISLFTFAIDDCEDEKPYYCYRYPGGVKFLRHIEYFYYNRSLIRALREWIGIVKPDLIHIHNNYYFPASVLVACKGSAPIVQTVHDFRILCWLDKANSSQGTVCKRCLGDICYLDNRSFLSNPIHYVLYDYFPKRFIRYVLHRTIDCFIAPSRVLEANLTEKGFYTCFLPNFVDVNRYPIASFSRESHTVLFMGYLNASKGVDVLIRSFSNIVRTIPSATLEIVGDGPETSALKELSASLGLTKHIIFFGEIPNEEVYKFYQRANVVVLPSVVMENSPLIIYEAMASGCPVVASNMGGTRDLISEGENGLLFEAGDKDDLSSKLMVLLLNKEEAKKMGIMGRRLVESFYTPEKHVERYIELVRSLVSLQR